MLQKIDPTTTTSWKKLAGHYQAMKTVHMKTLFAEDKDRFARFSIRFDDILVDYSKNIITEETKTLLLRLADELNLREAIEKMFGRSPRKTSPTKIHASYRHPSSGVAVRYASFPHIQRMRLSWGAECRA